MATLVGLFRLLKRCLEFTYGYPRCKFDYIEQNFKSAKIPERDLREYVGLRLSTGARLLLTAYFAFNYLRNILHPTIVFYERNSLEKNPRELSIRENGTSFLRVACLVSDCPEETFASRRPDGRVAANLIKLSWFEPSYSSARNQPTAADRLGWQLDKLPFYPACHPILSELSDANVVLDYFGMFLGSMSGMLVLIPGVIFPIVQLLWPVGDYFYISITAPRIARRVMLNRVRRLRDDLVDSFVNFQLNILRGRRTVSAFPNSPMDKRRLDLLTRDQVWNVGGRSRFVVAPAHDCLPLTRTVWWHRKLCLMLFDFTLVNLASFWLIVGGLCAVSLLLIEERGEHVRHVMQQMRRNNCSIWSIGEPVLSEESRRSLLELRAANQVDLSEFTRSNWCLWRTINFAFQWLPVICMFFVVGLVFLSSTETFYWLCEIKFQLTMCTEFAQHLTGRADNRGGATSAKQADLADGAGQSGSSFDMRIVREKYKSLTEVYLGLLVFKGRMRSPRRAARECKQPLARLLGHGPTRLESANEVERFALNAIDAQQLDRNSLVSLMEKTLVSYRLFVEYVHNCAPSIATYILCTVFASYSIFAVGICYIKWIKGFSSWPIGCMLVSWFFSNLCILLASNFHAKLRKMQPLIWSLLARTADTGDLRLEHLRALWLKQAEISSADGGLAFSSFGIRITYVNIIQFMLGLGTVMVLVLRALES